jgi:hypothetical protein
MPDYYDISLWNELKWYNTGGTRAKRYVQEPATDNYFYFKQSDENFIFEFWSEIMAYEIGQHLGFDVLRYDVAFYQNKIGCICKSMIKPDEESLIGGGQYLQAFETSFNPEDKQLRKNYTFQLIEGALQTFKLDHFLEQLIEIIVFDAIIGNGDRHQENWAFIGSYSLIGKGLGEVENSYNPNRFEKFPTWVKNIVNKKILNKDTGKLNQDAQFVRLISSKVDKFTPIFDSGSSLARELTEEKISAMLSNKIEFDAYIGRGKSEIHWEGKKIKHFDLIDNLLKTSYTEILGKVIKRCISRHREEEVKKIMDGIDKELPSKFQQVKLSENRKSLIHKLITLRIKKLEQLILERV